MRPGYQEQILYILNKHHSIVTVELGDAVTDDILQLIDSAKREELELYVKYIENTDKFYPLYASLDRETAIDECRKFASNYGKHRIAQLEQSEESI